VEDHPCDTVTVKSIDYYTISGQRLDEHGSHGGICIAVKQLSDGTVQASKVM